MTDIVKVEQDGIQVYPQTHTAAIENLDAFVDEKITGSGAGTVISVNGKTGEVVLSASDIHALPDTTQIPEIPGNVTTTAAGLMSAEDKTKLDGLPMITLEKVGEV